MFTGTHHSMYERPKDSTLRDFAKCASESLRDDRWLSRDRLNIVVAYTDKNRYIGLENDLPWKRKLRGDASFVNVIIRLVPSCALIMGRHTFESMPRKAGITQIVLTRNTDYNPAGAVVLNDFDKALGYCADNGLCPIVFGGSRVYESALQHPFRIFYTLVEEGDLKGDTRYPGHDHLVKTCFNISHKVDYLLQAKQKAKSWVLDGDKFAENGIRYSFYIAEN